MKQWAIKYTGYGCLQIVEGDYEVADLSFGWDSARAYRALEDAHHIVALHNKFVSKQPHSTQ